MVGAVTRSAGRGLLLAGVPGLAGRPLGAVVGLPVVANVSVLYMVEVEVGISEKALDVGALMLFRGSAEICGGLVAICIQIEAGGSIHREKKGPTSCIAQVTFTIDVTLLWVIDIDEDSRACRFRIARESAFHIRATAEPFGAI